MRKVSMCYTIALVITLFISFLMGGTAVNSSLSNRVLTVKSVSCVANGDFETGTLDGWEVNGICSVSNTIVHNGLYSAYVSDYTGAPNCDDWLRQNVSSSHLTIDSGITLEAWVYPLKVGPIDGQYPMSRIELWFMNESSMTWAYTFRYTWCNSERFNVTSAGDINFELFSWNVSEWNFLHRNVTADALSVFGNIDFSNITLYYVDATYHYSTYSPGAFYVDDILLTKSTIVVPDDYPTIQAAINAANDGDTIFVRNRTYYENVVVNKTVTLIGESIDSTIIDGSNKDDVIQIEANNVSVSDFTLQDTSAGWCGAIVESGFSNIAIANNRMVDNHCGVAVRSGALNVTISNNSIFNRQPSYADGIRLFSAGNLAIGNTIMNESSGIGVDASGNRIEGNLIANNSIGIGNSPGSYFFHNNLVNNGQQATAGGYNSWDNGYPSGGNYWSDYAGTDLYSGAYQNQTGSDGIGDSPYVINSNNVDNYPLMSPYVPFENQTIYINADGSVDPSGAPILRHGDSYTLTDNITSNADGIAIERYNIVLDGAGFTIRGNGTGDGIGLVNVNNTTIKNANVENFDFGMQSNFDSSSNNTISGNNITNNDYGIDIGGSNNIVSGNNIIKNWLFGIYLQSSSNNSISENNVINSYCGISLYYYSSDNIVSGNNITANNAYGINIGAYSSNNSISQNNITNNDYGIWLGICSNNNVSENNMIANNWYGIGFNSASNNKFCHNSFINNTQQVDNYNSSNIWDDGYPSGGNYWSEYNGTDLFSGVYQNVTGSDGIGDTPYIIDSSNTDNYPLMKPYPWSSHDVGVIFIGEVEYPIYVVQKTFTWNSSILRFDAFIMNYGDSFESTNVTAYANGTIIDHVYNVTIASHNSTILDLHWNSTGFLSGYYNITVYAEPVIGESDLTDNVRSTWMHVYIFGDINGDGKVDIRDIASLAKAFGQTVPPANPDLDVNQDWKIDIRDIAAVAKHFGEHV